MKKIILFLLAIMPFYSFANDAIIANHESINIKNIPDQYIESAKNLRMYYWHTSHGSQIISGLEMVYSVLGYKYAFNASGVPSFYVEDNAGTDLGHNGNLAWVNTTRSRLETGPLPDIVMWSWCGGCSDNTESGIQAYLSAMNQLEIDYPDVTFIYMTGHLDGTGIDGNLHMRNEQIRHYCIENNKILFDFADIESYDPSGNFFLDKGADDACNYDSGNWAVEWCDEHPGECHDCNHCAHSHCLNCWMKGKAFWWLLAKISGWDGSNEEQQYTIDLPNDFGSVIVGESTNGILKINNLTSDTPLTANNFTLPKSSPFYVDVDESITIQPESSEEINIIFSPYTEGDFNNELSFDIAGKTEYVPLSGSAYKDDPGDVIHLSGVVSGTYEEYTKIYVDGDLEILEGTSLNIYPTPGGTDIIFTGPYKITVQGQLNCIGTWENPINFIGQDTKWRGIKFIDLSNHECVWSILYYCNFYDASAQGEDTEQYGGVIYAYESDCVEINSCSFNDCEAQQHGGAIYLSYSDCVIKGSYFEDNHAQIGGAIYIDNSDVTIQNCQFTSNNSVASGGAITCYQASPAISYSLFKDNTSAYKGGAVLVWDDSSPLFTNCLFYNNHSEWGGAMIFYDCFGTPEVTNCTFLNNIAMNGGGACAHDPGSPHYFNSIFWNNHSENLGNEIYLHINEADPVFTNCNISGGFEDIEGGGKSDYSTDYLIDCIDADPKFIAQHENDFHISGDSPCVDAGSSDCQHYSLDFEGNQRIINKIDIGCYEYQGAQCIDDLCQTDIINVYPNPAKTFANIDLKLSYPAAVKIELIDQLGNILYEENLDLLGKNISYKFPVNNYISGVYIIRLITGNRIIHKKIIINN